MSWLSDLFDGGSDAPQYPELEKYNIPEFWFDPYVGKSQDYLWNFGENALEGVLPETYQPLIQFGSKQFEDMLGLTTRDITKTAEESAAKRGLGRGANINASIAKAVADTSIKARYSDYTNTLANLKSILGTGLDTITGVRSAALTNQGQKNNYELGKAQLEIGQNSNLYDSALNSFDYNLAAEDSKPTLFDTLGQVGNVFGGQEGQDNVFGNILSMFSGGSQDSGSSRGSAEGTDSSSSSGSSKQKTDWVKTSLDIAKLIAMVAAM